ncbi:hypothetical protein BT96DRAFT_977199 [Gymnopus androsaceus JB14]|uniref:Uncharacterized protein n=1 Tax=Gymnopus androsaceus JB14 TaxID=1447944 RepID=A0A6A4HF09_9AGAR|nr:hypothetical protein BT96DRAFT_977199 [Gymnopus androsaceus JB14]
MTAGMSEVRLKAVTQMEAGIGMGMGTPGASELYLSRITMPQTPQHILRLSESSFPYVVFYRATDRRNVENVINFSICLEMNTETNLGGNVGSSSDSDLVLVDSVSAYTLVFTGGCSFRFRIDLLFLSLLCSNLKLEAAYEEQAQWEAVNEG